MLDDPEAGCNEPSPSEYAIRIWPAASVVGAIPHTSRLHVAYDPANAQEEARPGKKGGEPGRGNFRAQCAVGDRHRRCGYARYVMAPDTFAERDGAHGCVVPAAARDRIAAVPLPPARSRRLVRDDGLRSAQRFPPGNRLLAALPRKDRLHFIAGCEDVNLVLSDVLCESGERIRHVYFPTGGFISLVASIEGPMRLEVGLVGDEGMVGTPLVLGVATSPLQALVQGAGSSLRMEAPAFRRELGRSPALRLLFDRYLFVRMTQLAQAAGCTRLHLVEARLARWLLMTQDRAHSNAVHITHEFLAMVLGVRRVGVTKAATSLQKQRLIRYSRGDIVILDRTALKAVSCVCYKADRDTYDRVLG